MYKLSIDSLRPYIYIDRKEILSPTAHLNGLSGIVPLINERGNENEMLKNNNPVKMKYESSSKN
jgi:hypothetical protein